MENVVMKLNINDKDSEKDSDNPNQAFNEVADKGLKEENTDTVVAMGKNESAPDNILSDEDKRKLFYLSTMSWDDLIIREDIKKNLFEMGFTAPSKIQASTYDIISKVPYESLIAQAPNGCGKTGAFGIPIINRIDESNPAIQAVVFSHNREMVIQTATVLQKMCKNTNIKVTALLDSKRGVEVGNVAVCTPGNFDKIFLSLKLFKLDTIKIIAIDEADYMIDSDSTVTMFKKLLDKLAKEELKVQFLFFSATYTSVHFSFIKKYIKKAYQITVERESLTLKNIRQMYFKCSKVDEKVNFVEEYLKRSIETERCIIFVNTAKYTVQLTETLRERGYKVFLLMGKDMDKSNRDETIKKFNSGEIQILITTDLLSRGFDEKLVKLVINFDIPVNYKNRSEADYATYLHRIGRTGRFGSRGIGMTLICDNDRVKESEILGKIEEFYKSNIEEIKSIDSLMEEFKNIIANKF